MAGDEQSSGPVSERNSRARVMKFTPELDEARSIALNELCYSNDEIMEMSFNHEINTKGVLRIPVNLEEKGNNIIVNEKTYMRSLFYMNRDFSNALTKYYKKLGYISHLGRDIEEKWNLTLMKDHDSGIE
jgi:hypothetical protein